MSATGHAGSDKVRRKTHLPRDPHGFIRVQWLENFYETLYASNERDIAGSWVSKMFKGVIFCVHFIHLCALAFVF